jgi:hypothetical protein
LLQYFYLLGNRCCLEPLQQFFLIIDSV